MWSKTLQNPLTCRVKVQGPPQDHPTWTDWLQQHVPCARTNRIDNLKYILVAILGESWVSYFQIKYNFGESPNEYIDAASKFVRLFEKPVSHLTYETVVREKRRWLDLTNRLLREFASQELKDSHHQLTSTICEDIKSNILANTSFMIDDTLCRSLSNIIDSGLLLLQDLHEQNARYSMQMLEVSTGAIPTVYYSKDMEDMGGEDEVRLHGMPLEACLFPALLKHRGPAVEGDVSEYETI